MKLLIDEYEADNLKNLGINFNNIKKLEIHFLKEHDYVYNKNYSKNILSFFIKSKSNLLYLKLKCYFKENYNYDNFIKILFNDINKFKSLKILELYNFHIHEYNIKLELYDLEKLAIINCTKIFLDNGNFLKLKNFSFINSEYRSYSDSLTKLPELENYSSSIPVSIIDLESSQKIKSFKGHSDTFLIINKHFLEKVYILNLLSNY